MKTFKIEISARSFVLMLLIVFLLVFLWEIRLVFFIFFIAFILNSAFRPLVDFLETKKIPRIISAVVIYLLVFLLLSLVLVTIVNEAISQLGSLLNQLPDILSKVVSYLTQTFPWLSNLINAEALKLSLSTYVSSVQNINVEFILNSFSSALGVLNSAITFMISVVSVIMISLYMLVRKEDVYTGVMLTLAKKTREKYIKLLERIEYKLGGWLRGQFLLMILVSFTTWVGIMLPAAVIPGYTLHNYALPIAFAAAIFEAIPGFGPTLTGAFTAIIAAGSNPGYVILYVIILFMIIQQFESIILSPNIMNRIIGLDPLVIIFGFLAGFTLFGIMGVILVVPILAVLQIIIEFGLEERRHGNEENLAIKQT